MLILFRGYTFDRAVMMRIIALDELLTILNYGLNRHNSRYKLEDILPSHMVLMSLKKQISVQLMYFSNHRYHMWSVFGYLRDKKKDPPASITQADLGYLESFPN